MSLLDILKEKDVIAPLSAHDKKGAIQELIHLLKKNGKISDEDKVYQAVMMREDKVGTGLDNGIAVPHAKTAAVHKVAAAVGISPAGIDFDSLDGKPAKLIFLIIAPPTQSGAHIALLSEIARLTKYASLCDDLADAKSAEKVMAILRGEE
jgi:fructose-specific phosphotransferase system IIA component